MTRASQVFAPAILRNYALVADGERGAVVGPHGDVAFLCAPRWHDPAVFSTMIGGRGLYAVTPREDRFVWGGYYESGTLVWRNRWVTTSSVIECLDALALPADLHRLVLLRRIEATQAEAHVEVTFDPRAEFGSSAFDVTRCEDGVVEGRSGDLNIRWFGASDPGRTEDGSWRAHVDLPEGGHQNLVLEISDASLPTSPPDPEAAWAATFEGWQQRSVEANENIAQGDVDHSLALLHGLTSSSGGMVAAATTSIPERSDAGRNYDYRFAWIRDQCYAGQAAAAAGDRSLLVTCSDFVAARLLDAGPDLKPAYKVDGEMVPSESRLQLPGYPGGQDVVGNHVNAQFQLDAVGEILRLLAKLAEHDLDREHHRAAAKVAHQVIVRRWQEPDAGVWELEDRQWTHSKLICAAGLRSYARLRPGPDTSDWDALADHIVVQTARTSVHPSGRWKRAADDDRVDAALLLPALRGAVPIFDPRSTATMQAVRKELGRDGFVYRFRHDDRPLDQAEGAFLLCGFWMALAEHEIGHPTDAVRWFERSRSAVGPPGIFTEEFDVVQRQLRGNLPQSFVHALLVEVATRLARPPESGAET